jgi:hypothetical protein
MIADPEERAEIEKEEEAMRVMEVYFENKSKERQRLFEEKERALEEKEKVLEEHEKALKEKGKALEEQAGQIAEWRRLFGK